MSLFAMLAGAAMAAAPRPNFVILFVDDMGIDQIEVPPGQRSCVNFVSSKKEKKETAHHNQYFFLQSKFNK